MKINKERAQVRLRDCWPSFLRDFLKQLHKLFDGRFSVTRNNKGFKEEIYICFNFALVECKEIYAVLARILEGYDTWGFLNLLTERLAEISNLAEGDDVPNDIKTRGGSINRGINRYRAMTI